MNKKETLFGKMLENLASYLIYEDKLINSGQQELENEIKSIIEEIDTLIGLISEATSDKLEELIEKPNFKYIEFLRGLNVEGYKTSLLNITNREIEMLICYERSKFYDTKNRLVGGLREIKNGLLKVIESYTEIRSLCVFKHLISDEIERQIPYDFRDYLGLKKLEEELCDKYLFSCNFE